MKGGDSSVEVIVAVASWEPRFALGMRRTLGRFATRRVLNYFMQEYGERTSRVREELGRLLAAEYGGVVHEQKEMGFDAPIAMWHRLELDVGPGSGIRGRVLVDLTTMPREMIWSVLFWLEASSVEVDYVYYRPETYAGDWLARDPNSPRLVYKLAGTLEVGRPTALVAVTGFDENRCRQAIEFYEPARVLLATQRGNQFKNDVRNIGQKYGGGDQRIARVEVDAFGEDHGYRVLRSQVGKLAEEHNVILCSFGPKPSAIALYRLQREFPQTALAYIGCKEYNPEYSTGLGEAVSGTVLGHCCPTELLIEAA